MTRGVADRNGPQAFRYYRSLEPMTRTDWGDMSTPKFAEHDDHVKAVRKDNWGRGYPVLNVAPFRRQSAAA